MGISTERFYDDAAVAILPMGFCFPGTGSSGDPPPRAECAPAGRARVLAALSQVELSLVVSHYAQRYHLPDACGSVTEVVRAWRDHWPDVVPLPHPSPRNNIWMKNPRFELELVSRLRARVVKVLGRQAKAP